MGNYFFRKGTSKEATLFVRIRKRVPKIDKNVNTRIVIDRNVWERANKDAAINRYIKDILKRLSEEVPSLQKTEITKLTMREREAEARGDA